jgi:class 3 adenylate cyclase
VIRDKTTDSNQAFVIRDGRARLRVVQIGDAKDNAIRIVSGIAAGEVVALNNQNELFDGAAVAAK